jgi:hypothetical protein
MITKVFPDWYKVNIDIRHHEVSEREQWLETHAQQLLFLG